MSASPLLKVEGLKVNFGPIEAVKGIDFELREGQITTLVGANGAGKSTTLLALSGLVKKAAGRVSFDGRDLGLIDRLHDHVELHTLDANLVDLPQPAVE